MTVRELIELNSMIADAKIEIRKDGHGLVDCLNIGPAQGIKPPYPMRVPKKPEYVNNQNRMHDEFYKDAAYIDKSINAWDDGKEYWEIKVDRIPKRWLDLAVFSWEVWPASSSAWGSRRRYKDGSPNNNFHGQRINIVALPDGQQMPEPEPREKKPQPETDNNQMTIDDWFRENGKEST